jgi:hypothetical protein
MLLHPMDSIYLFACDYNAISSLLYNQIPAYISTVPFPPH